MYNVSNDFKTAILEADRVLDAKVSINGTMLDTSTIVSFSIERKVGSDNLPVIGSVSSARLSIVLNKDTSIPPTLANVPIIPYVGVYIESTMSYEYIPLGTYYATQSDVTHDMYTYSLECLDIISSLNDIEYSSALTFPSTMADVIAEIGTSYSLTMATLPTGAGTKTVTVPATGTLRTALSEYATLIGSNVFANYDGAIEFKVKPLSSAYVIELGGNQYFKFDKSSDAGVTIDQLIVTKTDEDGNEVKIAYPPSTANYALSLTCDNITSEAELQDVYKFGNYPTTYTGFTLECQGMPHVQEYDWIRFTDIELKVEYLLVATHRVTFNGGLVSSFEISVPESQTENVLQTGGSTLQTAINALNGTLRSAIVSATALISGNSGGHVMFKTDEFGKPQEILIMDTEDILTAVNVWRWNLDGLGFSSTGYNGTYGTAITQDGAIVADYITTGTLSADVIGVNSITPNKLGFDVNKDNLVDSQYIISDSGTLDKSEYLPDNIITYSTNEPYSGFRFDSKSYYFPTTKYRLTFYIRKTSGTIDSMYIYNGKNHTELYTLVDGYEFDSVFSVEYNTGNTDIGGILDDGLNHQIDIMFETADPVLDDINYQYTYIQFNRLSGVAYGIEITGFKLEQELGNLSSRISVEENKIYLSSNRLVVDSTNFTLDESGNAWFGGNIETALDAEIGNELLLHIADTTNPKGIYFNGDKTRGIYANTEAILFGTINTQEAHAPGSLTLYTNEDFYLTGGYDATSGATPRVFSTGGDVGVETANGLFINGQIISEAMVARTMPASWSAGTLISVTLPTGFTNANTCLVAVQAQQSNGAWYDLDRYDMFRRNSPNSIVATSSTISAYASRPVRFIIKRYTI